MPARSTRQEARARILGTFQAQLDRMIPEDESIPLKGATFMDFEDQVEDLARAALPVALEERASLEPLSCATGLPPLNRSSAGIAMILKRCGVAGFDWMSIFATNSLSPCCSATCSITGAIALHG